MRFNIKPVFSLFSGLCWSVVLIAQPMPSGSLQAFLDTAAARYPLLKARKYEAAGIISQSATVQKMFSPELDAMYQANYATYNNITGMNYPQYLLPISGPPSADNTYSGVFGSAASVLFKWQAVTFGRKKALLAQVEADGQLAGNQLQQDLLDLQLQVTHAYLEALAATALANTFSKNVDRTTADLESLRSLARNGIKPGVDTMLLAAEISKARIGFFQATLMKEQSLDLLRQLVVAEKLPPLSDTLFFTKRPRVQDDADSLMHPLLSYYDASIEASEARRKYLEKTAAPSVGVWGSTYARGSGIDNLGNVKAMEGLGFQRFNYGLGAQLHIPILQKARIKPQLVQQEWEVKAQQAQKEAAATQLRIKAAHEQLRLKQALMVADESAVLQQSSAYAYEAMRSRYESGIATISELLQAQYGLLKAETDYRLAGIEAWKAALELAMAKGSIQSFLEQIN